AKTHLATDLQDSKDPAAANEAIALFQSIRERGMEYAGSFYSTAVYRIAHGYVTQKDPAQRALAQQYFDEHKGLKRKFGLEAPSVDELRRGNFARAPPPAPRSATGAAAAAPRTRWIELEDPIFVPEAEERVGWKLRELTRADVNGDRRDDLVLVDNHGVSV